MTIKQTTLPNGLRIVTAALADAHSLTANIYVGTGSRFEDWNTTGGISHFLEHLLFKGTTKYPSAHIISEAIDAVGGFNNAFTSEDVTNYFIKVPSEHGELALDILADMVSAPLLEAEEIDRERGVIIEEMNVYRDDPARFVGTMLPPLLFPDNPLGREIIGSEEVINTVKRDTIADYQRLHYVASNLVVSVAGNVDHDAVVAQITASLGSLESGKREDFAPIGANLSDDLAVTQVKDTAQAHFMVAARALPYGHADESAMRLLAAILGRGMSSRLFTKVREEQGLAYTVYSETMSFVDTGMFFAYAGVTLEKTDQAITAVLHELAEMRREPVGAAELKKVKQQLKAGLEMSLESNSNIADRLGAELTLQGKIEPIEETIAKLQAVTAADIQRVAGDILAPEKLRFSIIAPEPEAAAAHFKSEVTRKEK